MFQSKKLLLSIFLISTSIYCLAQTPGEYSFYQGDSLKGFDISGCCQEAIPYAHAKGLNAWETSLYIRGKEDLFVAKKYGIKPSVKSAISINPVPTSACNNLGFESGDFTGWTGGYGYNYHSDSSLRLTFNGVSTHGIDYPEPSCAYNTLVDIHAGLDPYGAFPMLDSAGGNYALRLGGEWINMNGPATGDSCTSGFMAGGQYYSAGEMVQQTFPVTIANHIITYKYAVVLGKATHSKGECPYFSVEVRNVNGDTVSGMQFRVQSDSTNLPAGMFVSNVSNGFGGPMFASKWRTNSINLTAYIGQNITLRFTAAGCTHGGHQGYAYIDATCGSSLPTGIQAIPQGNLYVLSPNPFDNSFTIEGSPSDDLADLRMYNAIGKEVLHQKIHSGRTQFNTYEFSSGVYFIHIIEKGKSDFIKLIKN
jgi:hypothetical protein